MTKNRQGNPEEVVLPIIVQILYGEPPVFQSPSRSPIAMSFLLIKYDFSEQR